MNISKTPLLTIITVSYNAVATIEQTILSVVNQYFEDYEYLIIDGGSTDGTVDIIKKYQDKITYWVSEPDKGIYAAMNKGAAISRGKWLCFMNSGDTFYNTSTLEDLFSKSNILDEDCDVIYGNTNKVYRNYSKIIKPAEIGQIANHLPFCHQSSFVSTEVFKKYNFNLQYKIVADDHLFYSLYKDGHRFCYIDQVISNYEAMEGVSSRKFKNALWENYQIRGGQSKWYWYFRHYLPFLFRNTLHLVYITTFHE
ncbi:glycosyltransferase [Flavobacterium crocinum]|uniref:Glycosyltransferase n=1 Tax=Flavobacterium crocinum TaxID=2183896 RepID=A0A2S1YG33_9FLAO|nr:glycosyltransferase family 2 protein [Flavobacterium crocinum]AWK03012.1 glycosyltransferase [Flavobacterium crocinum]